jgi:hypothetical protein
MNALHVLTPSELVSVVASEMAFGVDAAVESWMAQIESALHADDLTTLGRMNAVQDVITKYKDLTGKHQLQCRNKRNSGPLKFAARAYGQ